MISSGSESEEERPQTRNPPIVRERINFTQLSDSSFKEKFRFSKLGFENLLRRLGAGLKQASDRNNPLPPEQQLLFALRFYASNSVYHAVADAHGPHKSTLCRVLQRVTAIINRELFDEVVNWPTDQASLRAIPQQFFKNCRKNLQMPCVGGCIDGTLIKIKAPSINEPQFVDRWGDHSINAMMVCGPKLQFYYVSANWPGSVSDSRVHFVVQDV